MKKRILALFLIVMMISLVCVSAFARTYAKGNAQHGVSCIVNWYSSVVGTASSSNKSTAVKVQSRMNYYINCGLIGPDTCFKQGSNNSGTGTIKSTVTQSGAEIYDGYANGQVGSYKYNSVGGKP